MENSMESMENFMEILENGAENRKVIHVIAVLRDYLGVSLAKMAKDFQMEIQDLNDMESMPPYGNVEKYLKVAEHLDVLVEALIKNDFTLIPESFFAHHPRGTVYKPAPMTPQSQMVGRQGEEFAFRRERERLQVPQPVLANLVMPYYKMHCPSPGYDIRSFFDDGTPYALEVKTAATSVAFRMTANEYDVAEALEKNGLPYHLTFITGWGSADQAVRDMTFSEAKEMYDMNPMYYHCAEKKEVKLLNGLAYFRQQAHMRQEDMARAVHCRQTKVSLYESGARRPSVEYYIRASRVLGVTIDDLLKEYEAKPVRIRKKHSIYQEDPMHPAPQEGKQNVE